MQFGCSISSRSGWAIAICLVWAAHVAAQPYPSRPIRYIVPYAAGGATDIMTRALSPRLSEYLGQQIVVDNRPGAGAIIGTSLLARATADGYTLMMAEIAHGANPALHSKLPYDTERDFAPVTLVALLPTILVVPPSLPVKTVGELIALARSRPGQLNYSSSGIGSANFLAAELFKSETGVDVVHVPYQGGGQAVTALLSGQAQMLFVTIPPALQHVKAGRLRALAVTGSKRVATLPDVPSISEAGLPGLEVYLWVGTLAPAGTPAPIIAKLNGEIVRVLQDPEVRERISNLGAEIVGGGPEQLARYIKAEIARWRKTIKPGLRAD
ncbi:MAG TPA: tripartite tricarboxylate transporter substrate binding protein [Burkholderiales bacterium]|nr:tripartite tricarboxylate transporter substrate binding protein [Burkholderiales bacterium]